MRSKQQEGEELAQLLRLEGDNEVFLPARNNARAPDAADELQQAEKPAQAQCLDLVTPNGSRRELEHQEVHRDDTHNIQEKPGAEVTACG